MTTKAAITIQKKGSIKDIRQSIQQRNQQRKQKGDCGDGEIHKNDNHYRESGPKALKLLSGLK